MTRFLKAPLPLFCKYFKSLIFRARSSGVMSQNRSERTQSASLWHDCKHQVDADNAERPLSQDVSPNGTSSKGMFGHCLFQSALSQVVIVTFFRSVAPAQTTACRRSAYAGVRTMRSNRILCPTTGVHFREIGQKHWLGLSPFMCWIYPITKDKVDKLLVYRCTFLGNISRACPLCSKDYVPDVHPLFMLHFCNTRGRCS